jgi:hypothetical protein
LSPLPDPNCRPRRSSRLCTVHSNYVLVSSMTAR